MSLLCPEGDTDRPTPVTAPKPQRVRMAVQQLRPGERLGEIEMATLAEQNECNYIFYQHVQRQNVSLSTLTVVYLHI
ncbi:hypothetical protein EXN66_Car020135 [Channa argus]|uniref:Uncharacterized protein n=1 Tax=Channa argus TaxID=215402 RepID=A0A6G1QQU1_CHAAH|nr:hypothetical protein EXN66_Car020135 [Channa argus]